MWGEKRMKKNRKREIDTVPEIYMNGTDADAFPTLFYQNGFDTMPTTPYADVVPKNNIPDEFRYATGIDEWK